MHPLRKIISHPATLAGIVVAVLAIAMNAPRTSTTATRSSATNLAKTSVEKGAPDPAPRLTQGNLLIAPEYAYTLAASPDGTAVFVFEPMLRKSDSLLYAAMLTAIGRLYPQSSEEESFSSELTLVPLESGVNAVALKSTKYSYLAIPVKAEDQGGRVAAMKFWREAN